MRIERDGERDSINDTHQIEAPKSGHFVWIDQPEMIVEAVVWVMAQIEAP